MSCYAVSRLAVQWLVAVAVIAIPFARQGLADDPAANPPQAAPAETTKDAASKADAAKRDLEHYELYKMLADTVDQVERNYVEPINRRELMEAAIEGIVRKLDPYSAYIKPGELDQFRSTIENEFGGIGIQLTIDQGALKVLSPLVGTPAYRAGIRAGDRILKIESNSTDGLSIDDAVRRLKGPIGSDVTITVSHPDKSAPEAIKLTRESIRVETVLADQRGGDDNWNFIYDRDQKIGYLRISAFSRETARELRKALESLEREHLRGLIVDLRFNPGGLLNSAIEISDLFVAEGRIVSTQGRNSNPRVWDAKKEGTFEGFPMAVLVNRYSASASEILSGCLQDHHRAIVVGERTWGKGSVQNVIELEGGKSALKLTTAAYMRPSGKNIHRFQGAKETDTWGVHPDPGYEVRMTDDEMAAYLRYRRSRDILSAKVQPIVPPRPTEGAPPEPPAEVDPVAAVAPGFVDRQLQKAVDFLTQELARAK